MALASHAQGMSSNDENSQTCTELLWLDNIFLMEDFPCVNDITANVDGMSLILLTGGFG